MPLDINSAQQEIQSKIDAYKTYREVSQSEKKLLGQAGNSASEAISQISSQLDKVSEFQKRFQRDPPNSMDQLLGFLGQTQGNGSTTLRFLRTKILEAAAKIEPKISGILQDETIKALGCSIEQTYNGVTPESLSLQPLPLRPQSEGIYIPVNSLDFFSSLKQSPETNFGKIYYEKPDPSADPTFRPYGGKIPFPMNKQLFNLMTSDNQGRSYSQINGKNYEGKSGQPLFDLQYTNTNSFGVTGDYYRVILLDREKLDEQGNKVVDEQGNTVKANNVGQFIGDYYRTIQVVDSADIGVKIVNAISGAININSQVGFGELTNQSRFGLIVQRILGLCFDDRREIDVSGVAKVAELDGVDDSFFELNEIDLRNIDIEISNVQNGIMEFEDCDNVKLPVDSQVLVDELIEFRNTLSGDSIESQVQTLGQIIDSISDNPEWSTPGVPNLNLKLSIDKNVIKKIPFAIFSAVLSPKILLPLYTLLSVVQSGATFTYNQAVTEVNTTVSSIGDQAANLNTQGSNIINSGEDFLKKYKTFSIEVISKINAEFLQVLYDILKADLVNLVFGIIKDLQQSKLEKKITIIKSLVAVLAIVNVIAAFFDYRKCKSLLDNILYLVNLVGVYLNPLKNKLALKTEIPLTLLGLASLLPGYSPERATINTIELLQSLGIPTGTLPDGSPNLMLLYNLATNKANDKEQAENGKIEVVTAAGPGIGKSL
jgi:hypothetical protein